MIYPLLEPVVGGGASLLVGLILLKSGSLVASGSLILGYPVWKIALAVHITAWILQFIGHGLFEGTIYDFRSFPFLIKLKSSSSYVQHKTLQARIPEGCKISYFQDALRPCWTVWTRPFWQHHSLSLWKYSSSSDTDRSYMLRSWLKLKLISVNSRNLVKRHNGFCHNITHECSD